MIKQSLYQVSQFFNFIISIVYTIFHGIPHYDLKYSSHDLQDGKQK